MAKCLKNLKQIQLFEIRSIHEIILTYTLVYNDNLITTFKH